MAYTFKDDGHALTYYREYNKEVGTGDKTLIGNWVEERALRSGAHGIDTGRYQLWTNPSSDPEAPQQTFTKSVGRPDNADTFRRVFAHNDHQPTAEMVTTANVPDPGYRAYSNPAKGAREALLEARAMALAEATPAPSEELPSQMQTTMREAFVSKELPEVELLGRRVMNGSPDLTWRKEAGVVAPHRLEDPANVPPSAPLGDPYFGKSTYFTLPIELTKSGMEKDC